MLGVPKKKPSVCPSSVPRISPWMARILYGRGSAGSAHNHETQFELCVGFERWTTLYEYYEECVVVLLFV